MGKIIYLNIKLNNLNSYNSDELADLVAECLDTTVLSVAMPKNEAWKKGNVIYFRFLLVGKIKLVRKHCNKKILLLRKTGINEKV